MKYRVNEIFTSVQGEGRFTGFPVIFLRLAGCSMGCSFCDTKYCQQVNDEKTAEELVHLFKSEFPSFKRVVITGGEPFEQNLTELIQSLYLEDYSIHIETNCAQKLDKALQKQVKMCCWVTGSPKKHWDEDTIKLCDEMKIVVSKDDDIKKALLFKSLNPSVFMYLQPESNKPENIKKCYLACCEHPETLRLSVQLHKLIEVK